MSNYGGTYRINNTVFSAPTSTRWQEQTVAAGLNGIPINISYRQHIWSWTMLPGEEAEALFALFDAQQSANTQPDTLETDPYDASGAEEVYGTQEYNDFVILSLSPRTRGLPFYDDVQIAFEVYVA